MGSKTPPGSEEGVSTPEAPVALDSGQLDMPMTAYLVLGVLVVTDESLTAGEIKVRAQHTVGRFYWAPAVSHIRREITRLIEHGMAAERTVQAGKRRMTLYEATPLGERVLRVWAEALPGDEPVMTKHPLLLKIWLAGDSEPDKILEAVDRYLESLRKSIDEMLWSQGRGRELGLLEEGRTSYPRLVSEYTLRSLYAEMANVHHLRDEISWRLGDAYEKHRDHPTTPLRRRGRRPEGRDG